MARFLQYILDIDEPTFSLGLRQLEHVTGLKGVDTRLIADITHKAHDIIRKLGLKPAESSAEEVYMALVNSVKRGVVEALLFKTDYVLMAFNEEVVSFNLIDVIENFHYELSFDERIVSHGRRGLRGEIVHRYIDSSGANEEITRHLASEVGLLTDSDKEYFETTSSEGRDDKPYILAIGDLVTDAFITLKEDQAEVSTSQDGKKKLSMEYGTKLPYENVDIVEAVGNSANAAVAFSRLGLRSGLMAYIGNDQAGKEALLYLESEKVDTSTISVQPGQKTNYHYVLKYGVDRTILVKYENYNYTWQDLKDEPDWIYLSMLSESAWDLHEQLLGYLEQHQNIKLAFQPGTFHLQWGKDKLAQIYKRCEVLVMNKEEAALVTEQPTDSVKSIVNSLHGLGAKIVVVTDGPDGAYVSSGDKISYVTNYPDPAPPLDRTGAGDAFASTIVGALALGLPLETAMLWAPINSMSVVQKLGAQEGLLTQKEIKVYLDQAPGEYKLKEYED